MPAASTGASCAATRRPAELLGGGESAWRETCCMATRAKSGAPAADHPTGTVTFLFSDIEGSTQRWERTREAMAAGLQRHDNLMHAAIEAHDGYAFKTIGDAFCVAFTLAADAIATALNAQRALAAEDFSAVGGLRVRMAVHTGHAEERDGDYFGPAVNRVARLLALGHGGQVLVSSATAEIVQDEMPAQSSLRDLGQHQLKDLARPEHVYELITDDLPSDFPSLRSLEAPRGNLPSQLTSFIGRESQVAEISALLSKARLVTVVGTGGVGKTRTVIQVAAELAAAYSDGTWFIDLAPITDSNLVSSALASVFEVRDTGGPRPLIDEVTLMLKDRTALLIFDNSEHVVAAAAEAVAHILRRCPKIAILATSREPLGVDGEETYPMPPLSVPPNSEGILAEEAMRYEAVALFVARATSAQKTFALTDANARFVTEIVRRLDGIALAIELAAPRIRAFSIQGLAKRLDERFHLLTSLSRTALPRHKTLRALIEWSYELLNKDEQRLFRWLSIFRGSFTLEAAQTVCTEELGDQEQGLSLMVALVEKSLVATELRGEDQRYRLLETTREYAYERLTQADEANAAAGRHCQYFVDAAQRALKESREISFDLWVARNKGDVENYRAAIDWGLSQGNDVQAGAAIAADLGRFWIMSSPREGGVVLSRAMTAISWKTAPPLRARLAVAAAGVTVPSPDSNSRMLKELARAVTVFADDSDRIGQISALYRQASILARSDQMPEALARFDEALALGRSLPNMDYVAEVIAEMAGWLGSSGNPQKAKALLAEAMAIIRRRDERPGLAIIHSHMAEMCFAEGDIHGALENAREALAIGHGSNFEPALVSILHNAAEYLLAAGEVNAATEYARESLALAVRREAPFSAAHAIEDLAQVKARRGDLDRAARLVGYADMMYARQAVRRWFTEQFGHDRTMSILRAGLSEERLASLMAEGAAFDETTAVAEAMATLPPKKA
jgi:predicted ATPase/class 3 adenylate cyclase